MDSNIPHWCWAYLSLGLFVSFSYQLSQENIDVPMGKPWELAVGEAVSVTLFWPLFVLLAFRRR